MLPLKDTNPVGRTPVVTYLLILANVLVYFLWQKGGATAGDPSSSHYVCQLYDWAAIPKELTDPGTLFAVRGCPPGQQGPNWLTPLTAMFMHGGLLHLGGNMLFLWIFGNNVEDRMGRLRFLVFYLLAGIAALALQVAIDPSSEVPTLGASGAIAGVLGAYIVLFPRARVWTWVFIVILPLRAFWVLGFWFAQQALFGWGDLMQPGTGGSGGVAYFAHIGGFVFGLLLVRVFAMGRDHEPPPPRPRPQPVGFRL
jgi:membrane associated rhomboid family serine protease